MFCLLIQEGKLVFRNPRQRSSLVLIGCAHRSANHSGPLRWGLDDKYTYHLKVIKSHAGDGQWCLFIPAKPTQLETWKGVSP